MAGVPRPEDIRTAPVVDGERVARAPDARAPGALALGAPVPGPVGGEAVGLVIGTVPATPLQFSVGLAAGQYLQLDDVVVTLRELPGRAPIQLAGVVTDVEAVQEGTRFASDVFLARSRACCRRRSAR